MNPLHTSREISRMSPKVFIKTFGCQMNEYDSDKMADVLGQAQGYEKTSNIDEADLIVFNTCSVRERAQEKVFSDLVEYGTSKPRASRSPSAVAWPAKKATPSLPARLLSTWCLGRKLCTACQNYSTNAKRSSAPSRHQFS
jgi:hypothetical protein